MRLKLIPILLINFMQKGKTKKILIDIITGAVVIGVIVVGYFAFKSNQPVISDGIIGGPSAGIADQVVVVGAQVAGTVRDLSDLRQAVEQSVTVFNLPAFSSLQDFSAQVTPEPVGRPNPFLPTDWKLRQQLSVSNK